MRTMSLVGTTKLAMDLGINLAAGKWFLGQFTDQIACMRSWGFQKTCAANLEPEPGVLLTLNLRPEKLMMEIAYRRPIGGYNTSARERAVLWCTRKK